MAVFANEMLPIVSMKWLNSMFGVDVSKIAGTDVSKKNTGQST